MTHNQTLDSIPLSNGWVNGSKYQETSSLMIINQFNKSYESMLHEIMSLNGDENPQVKLHLQNWIEDLTLQNKMLVKIVEELEKEAADRVSLLEEKLQSSSATSDKVMQKYKDISINHLKEVFDKLKLLDSDISNLIKFIERARENNEWNVDGLQFYTIDPTSLLYRPECIYSTLSQEKPVSKKLPDDTIQFNSKDKAEDKEVDLKELKFQLLLKEEELNSVKRSMLEIQDSLVLKVAEKQDKILTLHRELQRLENQYHQVVEQLQTKDCVLDKLIRNDLNSNGIESSGSIKKLEALYDDAIRQLEIKEFVIKELNDRLKLLNEEVEARMECQNCKHVQDSLVKLQSEYSAFQNHWESIISANEDQIAMLTNENQKLKADICSNRLRIELDVERIKEREKHNQEVANLKQTILELGKGQYSEGQNESLEQAKLMISEQRLTISNLQDTLTLCKTQLEDLQQKSLINLQSYEQMENKCFAYIEKIQNFNLLIDHLQDVNLNLEAKMFEYIQDVAILEMQLLKYQSMVRISDADFFRKNQVLKEDVEEFKCECVTMNDMLNESKGLSHPRIDPEIFCGEVNAPNLTICRNNLVPDQTSSIQHDNKNLINLEDILFIKDLLQQINNQYECKREHENEVHSLQSTINELQLKLASAEETCQTQLNEYSQFKTQLQTDFRNSLETAQNEIINLNDYITHLQEECCCIRKELQRKDEAVSSARTQIAERENSELSLLRSELDKVLQQYNLLKAQNENLHLELNGLKRTSQQNEMNKEHIKKCFYKLQFMQSERSHLQRKNHEHLKEIQHLQCAYEQLHENYQKVVKSVTVLQNEIVDYKNNNENICGESRNVIDNVRGWLAHQSLINQQLTQKFNHDQLVVHNLKYKVAVLEGLKSMCKCKLQKDGMGNTENNSSLASFESDSITLLDNNDDHSIDNDDLSDLSLNSWLKKVGKMAHKLHESNKFWKSKMSDDFYVTQDLQ